jgi:hypothetical protein
MPFTPNPFEDPMGFLLIGLIALFPFGGGAYYRSRSIYRRGVGGRSYHGYH